MACGELCSIHHQPFHAREKVIVLVSEDKEPPTTKESVVFSTFNEGLFDDKATRVFDQTTFVTAARGQIQQFSREHQYSEQDSDRDSIESREKSQRSLRQALTMPPTPPDTPKKEGAGAGILAMSPQAPGRPRRLPRKGLRFGLPLPAVPTRKRQRVVIQNLRAGNGELFSTRTSTERAEYEGPMSRAFPTRTATLHSNSNLSRQPEYLNPHIGDPCTRESLDHLLGCGHRVTTMEPEPCSSNCHLRDPPDHGQLRDLDSPYMCTACVVDHLDATYAVRLSNFAAEVEEEAARNNKGPDWIQWKIGLIAPGWQDADIREMKQKCEKGKICQAMWIDPDWREIVDTVVQERQQSESSLRRPSLTSLPVESKAAGPSMASGRSSDDDTPSSPVDSSSTVTSHQQPKRRPQWRNSMQSFFTGRKRSNTEASKSSLEMTEDASPTVEQPALSTSADPAVPAKGPPSPTSTLSKADMETSGKSDCDSKVDIEKKPGKKKDSVFDGER